MAWLEKLHPRVPGDHKGGGEFTSKNSWAHQLSQALASGRDEKPASTSDLLGGASAKTRMHAYADGRKTVEKVFSDNQSPHTEVMAATVGHAIGANVPDAAVHPSNDHAVVMQYVPGESLAKIRGDKQGALAHYMDGVDARRLAVLDVLIGNGDRHGENARLTPEGDIYGIDHQEAFGTGWFPDPGGGQPVQRVDHPESYGVFVQSNADRTVHFSQQKPDVWKDNPLNAADIKELRQQLESTRAAFQAADRIEWYDGMMARFKQIAKHAKGKQRWLA